MTKVETLRKSVAITAMRVVITGHWTYYVKSFLVYSLLALLLARSQYFQHIFGINMALLVLLAVDVGCGITYAIQTLSKIRRLGPWPISSPVLQGQIRIVFDGAAEQSRGRLEELLAGAGYKVRKADEFTIFAKLALARYKITFNSVDSSLQIEWAPVDARLPLCGQVYILKQILIGVL